jgi:glycine oxidase
VPSTAADLIVRLVERFDAVVVGGGIIGLACALRARERGLRVCVLERGDAGRGATHVAAGVLAPDPESDAYTRLARKSAELWPAFADELGDVGYTRCGSLVLAFADETPTIDGEWLDGDTVRGLEPGVAEDCVGAVLLADDAQVDPRRVAAALTERLGESLRTHADVVDASPERVELADGTRIEAERVVLAAGAWVARRLARRLPVVPVKGQTVRLRGPLPATRMIRGPHHIYVVPRASGETVIGATVEEAGFDETPSDAATAELIAGAARILPAIANLEVVEACAGLRPGTPDGEPLIGEWEGFVVAGGHFRNGILLAPVTAEAVAALLAGEAPLPEAEPFAPGR